MAYQIHGFSPTSGTPALAGRQGSAQLGRLRTDRQGGAGHSARAQNSSNSGATAAQGSSFDSKVTQTGDLEVTTDEGDKISISFAALSELHAKTLQAQSGGTSIDNGSASSSDQLAINVQVNGSLNDKELSDLKSLIGQLAGAIQDPSQNISASQLSDGGSLSSLNSFQFAYQKQTQVDYSTFQAAPPTSTNA
jgi:hypothetical protein